MRLYCGTALTKWQSAVLQVAKLPDSRIAFAGIALSVSPYKDDRLADSCSQ
jgi:hypothetical protein